MYTPESFMDPTYVMFGKLLLAMLLGAVIGTERAVVAHQPAGTRTFGLVGMGACLLVLVASYVNSSYLGIVNFPPLQLIAGVVTGIGFIGAGLIITRGQSVHGITTAAGLWIVTAIGISVGFGLFSVALYTTLLTLVLLVGMWYVENRFKQWFHEYQEDQSSH
ncbi:MAG: MgtC/SapB family protein [Patescibacteria group bacterium]|nr:MgtC/SapB family protein [bacterium]MDZ4227173.1 MgtC/SapB family protein [Patescibacteria group bacterium]